MAETVRERVAEVVDVYILTIDKREAHDLLAAIEHVAGLGAVADSLYNALYPDYDIDAYPDMETTP